ncbi:MAG: thioredoxin family protein [Scytonema sp. RU_4_4]|nr:thioredoxin family protein [Scytonema sp. RU_4_4]NJR74881.1 thioredoxin family protein [Scytonema sp. CRU_2_7]
MNKNLLRRRQLLSCLGVGAMLASTETILDLAFGRTDSSTSLNAVAAQPSTKALPEFQGINQWLNSAPLTTQNLKGKIVLIHFWTFGCINCQRTLPYVVRWHRQFVGQGLKVIGVHTPEFAFERDVNNVKRALKQHQITYPVPLDNDYKTWNAFNNEYWPHLFLADRQGFIQYDHIGEGAYEKTEQTIRQLLG